MAEAGCGTGVGCAAARSIAAIMSPLVTRPSLPVPGTDAGSMPLSAASLRTDGGTLACRAAGFGASGFGCARGAGCSSAAPIGAVVDVF